VADSAVKKSVRCSGKRGPKTAEGKARALANLRPWPAGVSGNPAGRMTAGAYVREGFNQMAEWTEAQLVAVRDNPAAPVAQRAAARTWLDAMLSGKELDQVIDHTDGKAVNRSDVTSNGQTLQLLPLKLDGDKEV
jgi:hypothetical protein